AVAGFRTATNERQKGGRDSERRDGRRAGNLDANETSRIGTSLNARMVGLAGTRRWVDARLRRKRDGCGGFFVGVKRTRKKDWGRRR
uniref:Uncharacterized protein n=1 Tax=Cucumis melo TaxID=3656 RepID=A0A9I9EL42_CUCME